MTRLHLGLLAPEFPPDLGGMAELARGLATALAAEGPVTLFCAPHQGLEGAPFEVRPILERAALHRPAARAALGAAPVDAWLALNAGLVPLAQHLEAPFFAYFHGNDFLQPWLPCGPALLERLRRPHLGRLRHALRRRALRRALGAVRHVFTNSRNTARLIGERLGLEEDRLEVAPPGVADAFFQDRPPAPGPGPLHLLTVSRLTRYTARKNVDGVLRALALLAEGREAPTSFAYTVVGDGDDLPRLEDLARELGLGAAVRFTGRLERAELLEAYRRADLFVLAPRATERDVEGFGIVYVEASASGVPVLGSREGGAVDAIEEGVNGLLVERSTPAAIAAGIERFAAERERFTAERARAFAEGFRWPRIAARVRRRIEEGAA